MIVSASSTSIAAPAGKSFWASTRQLARLYPVADRIGSNTQLRRGQSRRTFERRSVRFREAGRILRLMLAKLPLQTSQNAAE